MLRSEAIKNLLVARTHPDLAGLYNHNMEVQINVAQDSGDPVEGEYQGKKWRGFSDGITTWKPFRIPHNAKTEAEDNDFVINYDLAEHVEAIGMTGWDWVNKSSKWVAFDFDAITGHSDKHAKKLTESELQNIEEVVKQIPWVTLRRSTSGNGLHVYVFLNNPITANHSEHAAIARSIIGLMASITGCDFQTKVDACGGNFWVWHRKMVGTKGLTLIKQGEILTDIPANWRDHLNVINNRKKKIVPSFIEESQTPDIERMFDELTGQKSRVPLDDGHQQLIKWLHENKACAWWDQDNNCLVTHTIHLKEAHEKLGLRGIFKTLAIGREHGQDWNVFAHPLRKSAWSVRRFTPGVAEESSWQQDAAGWTSCVLNRDPDLDTASRSMGGIEHSKGGYIFREAEVAMKSASMLGVQLDLPGWIMQRATKLKEHKDGRLVIEIDRQPNDPPMPDWLPDKKTWTRIFGTQGRIPTEPDTGNYDEIVRHLITETGEDYGWMIKSDKEWRVEPLVHVRTFLKSLSLSAIESDQVLGSCIAKPWKLVCRPFQAEYLNDRQWNRNAPQFKYPPSKNDDLNFPSWRRILEHCGQSLDTAIQENSWAKSNGILTGAEYLKCWIASMVQSPQDPLPYLFFHGPQNSGKSIFHEAISLLLTKGCVRGDNALINQGGFNAELEGAICVIIEETDMRKNKTAYNRIKDYVTSIELPIHRKNFTPYGVPNLGHYIQIANESPACPIFPGDSRITMIFVDTLTELIPKKQLLQQLSKEAPDFIASILALELPTANDRLALPVINSESKRIAEQSNQTDLEIFLDTSCKSVDGNLILLGDFYEKFVEQLDPSEVHNWSRIKVGRELPIQYPKGRLRINNQVYIGNIAWKDQDIQPKIKLVVFHDHLENMILDRRQA